MYASPRTPAIKVNFPASQQPAQPVVYILTADGSERETLKSAIADAGFRAEAHPLETMFVAPSKAGEPSCLVLDGLPPRLSAVDDRQVMPTICLAAPGDVAMTVQAMKAGAIDVLARPIGVACLVDAVRQALDASAASLQHATERRQLQDRYATLSQRERQVMALVTAGLMNKQVAYELGISEITVKAHRGRAMRKMNARSLAGLVHMANRLPLSSPTGMV
jgi:FixJ family two-component response regulator